METTRIFGLTQGLSLTIILGFGGYIGIMEKKMEATSGFRVYV